LNLFLDANARPVAMGGAYTALANDANALLYNPAGLAAVSRNEATFMHNQHFEGITQEYAAFAHSSGWGLNLNFHNSGSVPKTTISNPNGTGLGETHASDMALGGGYGRVVSESLALGAGVKFIRESIAGYSGQTFALDMGALYSTPRFKKLTLGAALQNVGPRVRFQSSKENLPLNLRTGAAYGFTVREQDGVATLDITKERSESLLWPSESRQG
jgi:hypothetical protein